MSLEPRKIPDKSKETLLLSNEQMKRIVSQLYENERANAVIKDELEKKEAIKNASQNMTEKWKNTFAGMYKEKLESIRVKDHTREVGKLRDDILEEKYQEARRNYVLDQAKRRLYFQTDRIKRLHGAKLLAEVVKEREEQIKFNKNRKRAFDSYDTEYVKYILRDVDRSFDEYEQKKESQKLKDKRNAAVLLEQFAKVREKQVKKKEEEYRMRKVIQEEDEKYNRETEKEEQKIYNKKLQYRNMLDDDIQRKHQIRDAQKKMEEADIKRAQMFDDAKRKMAKMHKEKVKEFDDMKEERKNRVMKRMVDEVGKQRVREEKIFQKAVKEKAEQEDAKVKAKMEKNIEELKGIQDFYEMKLEMKKEKKIEEKRKNFYEGRQLNEQADNFFKEENEKIDKWKKKESEAQYFQLHQMERKRRERGQEHLENLEDYLRHMKSLKDEEETFKAYSKHLIEECEKKGLNTYPLRKAAVTGTECGKGPLFIDRGNIRPKYIASVADADELHHVAPIRTKNQVNTKHRLGFAF